MPSEKYCIAEIVALIVERQHYQAPVRSFAAAARARRATASEREDLERLAHLIELHGALRDAGDGRACRARRGARRGKPRLIRPGAQLLQTRGDIDAVTKEIAVRCGCTSPTCTPTRTRFAADAGPHAFRAVQRAGRAGEIRA